MQRLKHSAQRQPGDRGKGQPHGLPYGRLSARSYLDLGRQPRLGDLPARRPPYLEAAATAAAFMFLLYVILGGV